MKTPKTTQLFKGTQRKALRYMLNWQKGEIKKMEKNTKGHFVLLGIIGQLDYLLGCRRWLPLK